jgi:proton-translocating NADH-quinone oxidoreductase chain L
MIESFIAPEELTKEQKLYFIKAAIWQYRYGTQGVDEYFIAAIIFAYFVMWWWGGNLSGIVLGVRGFFLTLSVVTLTSFIILLSRLNRGANNEFFSPGSFTERYRCYRWLDFNGFLITFSFEVTVLSLLMSLMILIVFFMVLSFSYSYMKFDPFIINFFSYLSAFAGSMLMLVSAGNFIVFFMGWEGVGLSSFLLINFWTTRLQTSKASLKALLVNRVGDFFLLIGIMLVFKLTHSFEFKGIFVMIPFLKSLTIPGLDIFYIDAICICLLIAAMSKSAQAGLHIWLPDAMEGPTPVSAMIHAATMVTAGLYLLLRCSFLIALSAITLKLIFFIGVLTVLITSILGMWQYDIKKIIAFSTCSQLGYMMTIIGSSYFSLGFFHLLTHAFFKALLFLAAGGVIHSMQGEQDLRRLSGGLTTLEKNFLPGFLQSAFLIGTLSITGLVFFSGYYSKEAILFSLAYSCNTSIGVFSVVVLMLSVFFTSYYSFRLFYLLFLSTERSTTRYYQLNSTLRLDTYIIFSLGVLMIFSLFGGFGLKNVIINSTVLSSSIESSGFIPLVPEFVSWPIKILPIIFIFLGFYVAFFQEWFAEKQQNWRQFSYFFQSRYYYDNIVNKVGKGLLRRCFRIYKFLDKGLLEWVGPYGIPFFLVPVSRSIDYALFDKRIESSYLGFTVGIVLIVTLLADSVTSVEFLNYK